MKILNYYRTLNSNRKNTCDNNLHLSIVEIDPASCEEYKGFYLFGNYIIKDRVIMTEVVKPSIKWVDNFLDKGKDLSKGEKYFNYDRPLAALTHGKQLLALKGDSL